MRFDYRAPKHKRIAKEILRNVAFRNADIIEKWVDNNVQTIDDVKSLLKLVIKGMSILLDKQGEK